MSLHRYDLLMDVVTMLCLLPFGITGRIWRKSPPRTPVMLPNGLSLVMSSASKYILFAIGASSHSISNVFFSRSVKCEPCLMWMGNLECAVPSVCRSSATIPHDTTSAITYVQLILTGGGLIARLSRLQSRRFNRRMSHLRDGCRQRKPMSKCCSPEEDDMQGNLKSTGQ
ncbi:hypothetical protein VPH35_116771 [Triticum aestivum]